jgi:hypothetical protein
MTSTNDMAKLAADFPRWHVWPGRSGTGAETDWHATASTPNPGRLHEVIQADYAARPVPREFDPGDRG